MLFRRILVPAVSPRLLRTVEGLLPRLVRGDGEVMLLNVITLPTERRPGYVADRVEEAGELLEELSASIEARGAVVRSKIMLARSEAAAIIHESKAGGHDLVVLGSTGKDRGERLLLGNLVDDVVRGSPTNVMVVDYKKHTQVDATRVLVPTAGYDHSVLATQVAAALASPRGDEPRSRPGDAARAASVRKGSVTLFHAASRGAPSTRVNEVLRSCAMILDAEDVPYEEAVTESSDAARSILSYARKARSTMLVLGATRKPSAHQFLWGSTVDRVLKRSPCPCLVVKVGTGGRH
ncbi:MAG: universal stress protein [Euryarchaeota archaeon]|nr:universal stress protein [Euryarchaeota archaeon]